MKVLVPQDTKVMLDAKDWRILHELLQDSRQPLSQIAKQVLLSRQSVEYRIQKLEKAGLLTGYRAVINTQKLGYRSYHYFLNCQPKDEDTLTERALKANYVNALITYRGKYGMELSIMASSAQECDSYYEELTQGLSITEATPLILLSTKKATVLPERLFSLPAKGKIVKPEKYVADEKDMELMRLLTSDASLANTELAKRTGLSHDAVQYRIKKLLAAGYIIQFRPAVNYYVLNLRIHTVLFKLAPSKDFEQHLAGQDNVIWIAKTLGSYNYICYILTKDLNEFHALFDEIRQKFSVESYELLYAYTQLKYEFMAKSVTLQPR